MKMRENYFSLLLLIPYGILLFISIKMNNNIFMYVSIVYLMLVVFGGNLVYKKVCYEDTTTCAKHAGNLALKNNCNPCFPNGKLWNPEKLKVSKIFLNYKDFTSSIPKFGTKGFVFYLNRKGDTSIHMEFYDYTQDEDFVILYKYHFGYYLGEKGDYTYPVKLKLNKLKQKSFYSLKSL